jgi:hypothetical protein
MFWFKKHILIYVMNDKIIMLLFFKNLIFYTKCNYVNFKIINSNKYCINNLYDRF